MSYYIRALRDYAVFEGRATRPEFWVFFLVNAVVSTLLLQIDVRFGWLVLGGGFGYLSGLFVLATLVPTVAVGVRRLHDTGQTGFLMLLPVIPLLGWIILAVMLARDSQRGDNEFGLDSRLRRAVELPDDGGPRHAERKGRLCVCPSCGRTNPHGLQQCQWCHEPYRETSQPRPAEPGDR